ncbi:MAG: cysteine desulfurase NifS [Clostridia bacterium]
MENVYLDNSATTKMDERVLEEMLPYLKEDYGNASSLYSLGRKSKKAIEDSREKVAIILNCRPDEIYFTSGGSESDNTAIKGIARANRKKGNHIITSKIEHLAVLDTCKELEKEGFEVTYLDVDSKGKVNIEELKKAIRKDTILISIMYANNEIGTIQDIFEIGRIARENNVYFHTDAVQAMGNLDIDVQAQNIDSLSLSGHKFYGPKGIGVLYVRKNVKFNKFIAGGHQERNKRAGTENVANIVGLSKALEISYNELKEHREKILYLRNYYEEKIKQNIDNIIINGDEKNRLPGNSNISFIGVNGQDLLLNLDMIGICVSSGSACTSGSIDASHVLIALGVKEEVAKSSIRVSIGKYNTKEEIDYLVENLIEIVKRQRKI